MREPKWIMNMKGRSKKNLDTRTSSMGHASLKCVLSVNRNAVCFNSRRSQLFQPTFIIFCNSVVHMLHTSALLI